MADPDAGILHSIRLFDTWVFDDTSHKRGQVKILFIPAVSNVHSKPYRKWMIYCTL